MAAFEALLGLSVDLRKGFHMSITARRIPLHLRGPSHAKKPSRSASVRPAPPQQIAHDDTVLVALADRHLVDPDHPRTRRADAPQLLFHVLNVQRLDRVPIQMQLVGDGLDGRLPTSSSDKEREPPGIERVIRQPIQSLLFHLSAPPAVDAPDFHIQIDPAVAAGEVAHPSDLAVVPSWMLPTACRATRFFERRESVITREVASPKIPMTVEDGRKPGKR